MSTDRRDIAAIGVSRLFGLTALAAGIRDSLAGWCAALAFARGEGRDVCDGVATFGRSAAERALCEVFRFRAVVRELKGVAGAVFLCSVDAVCRLGGGPRLCTCS